MVEQVIRNLPNEAQKIKVVKSKCVILIRRVKKSKEFSGSIIGI
jgi:hypothetical protein